MSNLYNRIDMLCKNGNVSITVMCKEAGVSRASLSDLKMGRNQNLSADTLSKIAAYFGVTVDYLLGKDEEKAPTVSGERRITMDQLKLALFRGRENVTDAMVQEVLGFADLVALREDQKKKE